MIKGSVRTTSNEPLIGVSILVKGTTTGTVTDYEGNFELNSPAKEGTLVFSYTGYRAVEKTFASSVNMMDVVMEEDIAKLDEVVVTGLASGVKRSNSGNAVTTISGDELTGQTRQQTLDNALYGKIPGVNMSANSGAPGGGINVQLRGLSTLGAGSSQPLYIIDGVYVDNSTIRTGRTQVSGASGGASASNQDDAANRIADINPDDIEKIEVLKGPSAAAIYGTRANAGVIVITTKKGQSGETKVSFSQDIGQARGQNFQEFDTWDEAKINAYYGGGAPAQLAALQQARSEGRVTDWEDFFYGERPLLSNTQLSVSGGNNKTQFYVSGGILSEDGIIKNTGFDRYSLRANVDHRISDRLKVSLNSAYYKSDSDRGFTGNQNNTGGSIGYSIAYTPSYANLFPDANGNYPDNPYFNDNPIAIRDLTTNNQKVDRFVTAATLDWDIMRGTSSYLKFRLNGGVDYLSGNSLVHLPEVLQHQRAGANPGDVMWGRQDNLNTNIQAFLIFNADLGSINSTTSVGAVRLDQDGEFQLTRGRGLSGGQTNLAWARVVSVQEQTNSQVTDLGFVAQEDLNWKDRLIASLGVRMDRSTLNNKQDEYYLFPKASLAANLHNFDFWGLDFINQFKLRAAYGETGGLPRFGVTFESLTPQLIGGNLGGQVGTRGVDPNLVPETAQELEFGVDLALFNNLVTVEATVYNKQVKDLILDLRPAESTGILAIATNAADLVNRGFELGLGFNPVPARISAGRRSSCTGRMSRKLRASTFRPSPRAALARRWVLI
jgi:TonB-linked SusC/RagA family outer membrane protein